MRDASRFTAVGLSLTMACTLALALPAAAAGPTGSTGIAHSANAASTASSVGSTTGSTGTTGSTSSATGTSNATATPGSNAAAHRSAGSGLLCAGLLESGILADVFTVAPAARHEDLASAVQFAPVWSDSHQATVGNTAEPPNSRPAVASIKLPISFSDADRQKFTAAGWKFRKTRTLGTSYCLERTDGMICVTAAP